MSKAVKAVKRVIKSVVDFLAPGAPGAPDFVKPKEGPATPKAVDDATTRRQKDAMRQRKMANRGRAGTVLSETRLG